MSLSRTLWAATPIALVAAGILFMARRDTDHELRLDLQELSFLESDCCGSEDTRAHRAPPPPVPGAFVQLTGLGDDEMATQGFSLTAPIDVRIHAVGEGSGNEMYDYGWIVEGSSRRAVWRMEYDLTQPAGGADKNRVVDQVVTLEPGDYIVHFVTDGSHSWKDWNSSPPSNEDAWGIALIVPDGVIDPEVVQPYDESTDPAIIAHLTPMGDDVNALRRFALQEDTEVRIYALGEGSDGEMYDHGWIEDATTGRAVWEMTYRMSEHAGGADKNRLFDGTIVLPAGEYLLRYQSDGSHSAEEWNAGTPDDPFSWGVTLLRVGG